MNAVLMGSMAGQPGSGASASATATLVGNAFVSQYYNVLHQSPQLVHRFYTDLSKLSRSEVGANVDIVETQDKIQEKIMSMDLDGVQAEVKTVDSLASLNGSVLVMVTGVLSSQSRSHRNFVQTFFLAPQEKGYFVLSDIRRFLDGAVEQPTLVPNLEIPEDTSTVNAVEQIHEAPLLSTHEDVPESPVSYVDEGDVTDSLHESVEEENVFTLRDIPVEDDKTSLAENAPVQQEPVTARPEEQPLAVKGGSSNGATKLSYASILREAPGGSFTGHQAGPRKPTPVQKAPVAPNAASQGMPQSATTFSSDVAEDSVVDGGDGCSVYVKNLPLNILQEDLEREFQRFGSVKSGGVNIRNQKHGVCFAFIQFEDSSSVRSAVEASPISFGGRLVYVEEKKPTFMGPSAGRGRASGGRSFQGDGMNGRGSFGGRNFGQGGYSAEREFGGRGRGGRANSYGSNGSSVNGFRRGDSRPLMRGAMDQ